MVQSNPLSEVVRGVKAENRTRTTIHEPHSTHSDQPTVSAPNLAMPDYVEHREGATEIGRLSAEAVVREYEAAAKEIESMGGELIARARECEAMTRDALGVAGELNEIATRYRTEAKRVFEHIESCSSVVADAHKICGDLRDKISSPIRTHGSSPKRNKV
jgi:hypothetical protein